MAKTEDAAAVADDTVKQWITDKLWVEVSGPSLADEKAAFNHLFRRAEAEVEASLLVEEMQADNAALGKDRLSGRRHEHLLELSKVLRRAGKLSRDEYIFMAGSQAYWVHDDRITADAYAEDVQEIDERIKAIENEHGLKAGEYWPVNEGPEEWQALQRQWSAAIDLRFIEVLSELGLQDLADLCRADRAGFDSAFEQGRRSFHHKDDRRNAVASLIGNYEIEAKRAETAGAPYAAIVMYGAACEARLLIMMLEHPNTMNAALARLPAKSRPRGDPMRWTLDSLITVANAAGWLKGVDHPDADMPLLEWARTLKSIRNLLHPGRHVLDRPHISIGDTQVHDVRSIYVMICAALLDSTVASDATLTGSSI